MQRRTLITSLAAGVIAATAPASTLLSPPAAARPPRRSPFVVSDYAPLRRVLVHTPSVDDLSLALATQEVFDESWPALDPDATTEHEAFIRLLRDSGVEVLQVQNLLTAAIHEAKQRGLWATWLAAALPRVAGDPDAVNASTLLARDPRYQFLNDPSGAYRHVLDGVTSLCWTRDFGIMVPAGLIIANSRGRFRRYEDVLFRFLTRFAPELQEYPVVFDAAQEGLYLEGGDVAVLDEHTLLLGTGNCSDPRLAPVLARHLGMDVIAVQMRKTEFVKATQHENTLQSLFPHLDTCATLVGPKLALMVPWLFEARHAQNNSFIDFLRGAASNEGVDEDDAEKVIDNLADIGWVRRYIAGSGAKDETIKGLKLADWLRRRGFEVLTVGGAPPAETDYRHLVNVVFTELERQAANVLATAPNEVISYEGAAVTERMLIHAGATVRTFDGRELRRGNGGPHCLGLPLERG